MSIKILIADDHSITREGLGALLDKEPGIILVAEADNGRAALKLARKHAPDVIVMDINMPGLNGIEAARQVLADTPNVKIIALSMHSDRSYVRGMLMAGASGYLLKSCAFEELASAIRTVMSGKTYICPEISDIVRKEFVDLLSTGDQTELSVLTDKEREVLQLIAEGVKTKDISEHIHISVKTVEARRRQIMEKLNIHSVAELTKFAIREGLTSL